MTAWEQSYQEGWQWRWWAELASCKMPTAPDRMGGVAVRCLRAVKSSGRNQGWLLMSFTPPARQPYRLLRST